MLSLAAIDGQNLSNRLSGFFAQPRQRLTAPTTFYVRDTGFDTNNGKTDNVAGAKRTLQAMYNDLMHNYDFNGQKVEIVWSGTQTAGLYCGGRFVGASFISGATVDSWVDLTVRGDGALPSNAAITVPSGAGDCLRVVNGATLRMKNCRLTSVDGDGFYIYNSVLFHSDVDVGAVGHESVEVQNSYVRAEGNFTISGNAAGSFFHVTQQSRVTHEDQTVTILNSPVAGNYKCGLNNATVTFARCTITGGDTMTGNIVIHNGSVLNMATTSGTLMGAEVTPIQVDTNSIIEYPVAQNTVFVDPNAVGDNSDGYDTSLRRAFKTRFAALNYLALRHMDERNSLLPTLQCKAAGTSYATGFIGINAPGLSEIIILGDETTPANCAFAQTTAHGFEVDGVDTLYHLRGIKFTSTSASAISCINGSKVAIQNCDFGACGTAHISVGRACFLKSTGPFTVSGAAPNFLSCIGGEVSITHTGTFINNWAFSQAGVLLDDGARVRWNGTRTLTGTITGPRTLLMHGGLLNLNGAGEATLPGNSNGTPTNNAQLY